MANIWKVNREVNNETKRNNHDLSFQNHLTMKMGTLYPVFCKEVVPGDSFRINSAFGLKFMPLVFPVQSKMRAHMHFFYVRNKNLWNRWEDWIQGLKGFADGVVHPYIHQDADFFKTGSLADYLNVPTTLAVSGSVVSRLSAYSKVVATRVVDDKDTFFTDVWFTQSPSYLGDDNTTGIVGSHVYPIATAALTQYLSFPQSISEFYQTYMGFFYAWSHVVLSNANFILRFKPAELGATIDFTAITDVTALLYTRPSGDSNNDNWIIRGHYTVAPASGPDNSLTFDLTSTFVDEWNSFVGQGLECGIMVCFDTKDVDGVLYESATPDIFDALADDVLSVGIVSSTINDTDFETPFASKNLEHGGTAISALPFRAYESIYNAYYRDQRNQPLYIDGEIEYNRYNTTTDGGADQTPYHLFQRNYELDFLTSALPSPQQGNAPLVGMSALGTITITDPDSGDVTTAKAEVDNNGTITGLNVTSPIANREHALTLAEIASVGMNINSFRNTNALQAWLETNIRKGYRYLDFIEGHFGIRPEYRELDMPEFIGGFSRDVNVSQIVSSADTLGFDGPNSGSSLGSFNGMASCFGGSEHSITHYCDDYGFIIGILSVIPTPAYSQLLPKHFIKHNPLDYYFTEMSQLGMQPISYEEVCPVQAFNQSIIDEGETSIHDTFGYQRPNYDLVGSVDEIHGQFRNSLSNFLINRVFEQRPQLGDDFLRIDPDETNQIFVDQAPASDNIIGQIVFEVDAKRPIPRVHMPSLGR